MEIAVIQSKIYEVRGVKVMLDKDLASLYQVEVRVLNQAVKRNIKRFPSDFMFQLTKEEWENLKSQFVISSWGGIRKLPYAFTEQGLAMLSGILNSDVAIAIRQGLPQVNTSKELEELKARVKALEESSEDILGAVNDLSEETRKELDDIYLALSQMAAKQKQISKPLNPIGYKAIMERNQEEKQKEA